MLLADVPQTVTVQRVLDVMTAKPGLAVRRDLAGRSHRVRCTFAEKVGKTRARGPITCTIRVYRTWNLHGLLGTRTLEVEVIARRHAFIRRNGTGYATYSAGRSLGIYASHKDGA